MSEKHCGWTNKETWLMSLYYSDVISHSGSEYTLDLVEQRVYEATDPFITDFMIQALSKVNWKELEQHYLRV